MGSWRDRSVLAKERQPHGRTDRSSRPARALSRVERANALLKRTAKALERITLDPGRIGAITTAALVLLQLQEPKHARLKDRAGQARSYRAGKSIANGSRPLGLHRGGPGLRRRHGELVALDDVREPFGLRKWGFIAVRELDDLRHFCFAALGQVDDRPEELFESGR
jgi:hypothetical protein